MTEAEFITTVGGVVVDSAKATGGFAVDSYNKVSEILVEGFSKDLWNTTAFYEAIKPTQSAIRKKISWLLPVDDDQ